MAMGVSLKVLLAMTAATVAVVPIGAMPAAAASSDVVISELMYHPTDAADVEFLELTNRGIDAQDVSGWCLATGVALCLQEGTMLAPGQRIVVTDDATNFAAVYGAGVVPAGEYEGSLSNGGETIDLLDAGGAVIDTITYDDAGQWPAAPDGTGPSLELNDLFADNSLAVSWGTSLAPTGHSAGIENSLEGLTLPTVADMAVNPARPSAGEGITVSARITGTTEVQLVWLVGFGEVQITAMNDGPQSVGGANDGVWSAAIPGQAAGELVRYRVEAADGELSASLPVAGGTITYEGVVVLDPSVSSTLPILEWFMDDAVHDDLLANHRFDDVQGAAVISYNGEVIDGVLMNIRGNSSRLGTKVNWKVEFPEGHLFNMGGLLDRPVDEFNLQRGAFPEDELVWQTAADAGLTSLQFFKMRTQRNGEFYSVSSYAGVYDGVWRDAIGRNDWALYKAQAGRGRARSSATALEASGDWDKKEGNNDWSDLHELTSVLDGPVNAAQRDWMWEHLNVPAMINYAATVAVVRHSDSSWYNYYVTNDTLGTGRWEMYLWDLDSPFLTNAMDGDGDFLTPAANGQKFMEALMAHPEFQQMYMRRFRTLIDEKLLAGYYESQISSIVSPYAAEYNMDRARFGGRTLAQFTQVLQTGIDDRVRVVNQNQGADGSGLIPPSPTGNRPIVISEIAEAPAADSGEFIALSNESATESIDLSQWTVSGDVSVSIPGGTVLLPGATGYLVTDDANFRSTNGATQFVIGEFTGSLPDAGGILTLATATGAVVDSATFPDDDGPVDPPEPVDVTFVPAGANWRYLDNTAAPANWAATDFSDGGWDQGASELGFGDGDEATVVGSGSVTVYFRHAFEVADPAEVSDLVASLTADDGAVIYLNGVEVARDNMPAGVITPTTTASSTRFSTPERTARPFPLPSSALVVGTNVIAVEVHNGWAGSSDLSFNLALVAVVGDDNGGQQGPGEVVALGDQWRYFDGGAAPADWQAADFADAGWTQASAEFGFGDGDETTVLDTAPLTFYFRRSFQIDDPAAVSDLIAGINADDGAVIYINGIEVARDNMPVGPITADTPASSSRWGGANEGVVREYDLTTATLAAGTNVIAVEVHNRWYTSSDVSFDLHLIAD